MMKALFFGFCLTSLCVAVSTDGKIQACHFAFKAAVPVSILSKNKTGDIEHDGCSAAEDKNKDSDHDANAHSKYGGNALLSMMDSMMVAMDQARSNVSVEADFLSQMVAHHQGAIDMAQYEIANGKNFEMIQLAKSIVAEQQIEIEKMLFLLAHCEKMQIPVGYGAAMTQTMTDMMDVTPGDNVQYDSVDHAFAAIMLPHHQAAVDMAMVLLKYGKDPRIANVAAQIIAEQQVEIEQMQMFLKLNKGK